MCLCERKVIGAFGNEPNEDNYAIENLNILQRQVVNAVDSFLTQGEEYYDDVLEVGEGRAAGIPKTTKKRERTSSPMRKIICIYDKCYEGVGNNVILFQ